MLDRIAEFFIFGFAPFMIGILAVPEMSLAADQAIKGEITYRERIALPPNAELTVQLADVSLADAPATIVAEQKLKPTGQVPIKFDIHFDPSVIRPKTDYALQARIMVDNQLWFINDERVSVDPAAAGVQNIVLKKVAQ